ncbi:hypothetical protein AYI68_g5460 [Smittium mucronatum]|uniref:Uncharacterized protein n=1 Tax=Smittium mucronatum TaxID=133383 RepID=A0A1R0GU73_9FUNG|nr:hypothetical protein AYI68_g5460 [Smittium mucronatum]
MYTTNPARTRSSMGLQVCSLNNSISNNNERLFHSSMNIGNVLFYNESNIKSHIDTERSNIKSEVKVEGGYYTSSEEDSCGEDEVENHSEKRPLDSIPGRDIENLNVLEEDNYLDVVKEKDNSFVQTIDMHSVINNISEMNFHQQEARGDKMLDNISDIRLYESKYAKERAYSRSKSLTRVNSALSNVQFKNSDNYNYINELNHDKNKDISAQNPTERTSSNISSSKTKGMSKHMSGFSSTSATTRFNTKINSPSLRLSGGSVFSNTGTHNNSPSSIGINIVNGHEIFMSVPDRSNPNNFSSPHTLIKFEKSMTKTDEKSRISNRKSVKSSSLSIRRATPMDSNPLIKESTKNLFEQKTSNRLEHYTNGLITNYKAGSSSKDLLPTRSYKDLTNITSNWAPLRTWQSKSNVDLTAGPLHGFKDSSEFMEKRPAVLNFLKSKISSPNGKSLKANNSAGSVLKRKPTISSNNRPENANTPKKSSIGLVISSQKHKYAMISNNEESPARNGNHTTLGINKSRGSQLFSKSYKYEYDSISDLIISPTFLNFESLTKKDVPIYYGSTEGIPISDNLEKVKNVFYGNLDNETPIKYGINSLTGVRQTTYYNDPSSNAYISTHPVNERAAKSHSSLSFEKGSPKLSRRDFKKTTKSLSFKPTDFKDSIPFECGKFGFINSKDVPNISDFTNRSTNTNFFESEKRRLNEETNSNSLKNNIESSIILDKRGVYNLEAKIPISGKTKGISTLANGSQKNVPIAESNGSIKLSRASSGKRLSSAVISRIFSISGKLEIYLLRRVKASEYVANECKPAEFHENFFNLAKLVHLETKKSLRDMLMYPAEKDIDKKYINEFFLDILNYFDKHKAKCIFPLLYEYIESRKNLNSNTSIVFPKNGYIPNSSPKRSYENPIIEMNIGIPAKITDDSALRHISNRNNLVTKTTCFTYDLSKKAPKDYVLNQISIIYYLISIQEDPCYLESIFSLFEKIVNTGSIYSDDILKIKGILALILSKWS